MKCENMNEYRSVANKCLFHMLSKCFTLITRNYNNSNNVNNIICRIPSKKNVISAIIYLFHRECFENNLEKTRLIEGYQ